MRIRVNFTLEVPDDSLEKLREAAEADDNVSAGWFVRGQAEDEIKMYLEDHNVRVRTISRDSVRVDESFAW